MPKEPPHTYDHEMYDLTSEQTESDLLYSPNMIEQATMSLAYILNRVNATKIIKRTQRWVHEWTITLGIGAGLIGVQIDNWLPTPYNH